MSKALQRSAVLSLAALAPLLLDCGRARGPGIDSESHFLGCTSDVDCDGIAGATCANGQCVSLDLGEPPPVAALEPDPSLDPSERARCSTETLTSSISDQATLDAFEGCESIYGGLNIAFAADLRPLHALRNLYGGLSIFPSEGQWASLDGLQNLELIERGAQLSYVAGSSLAELSRLRSVGSDPGDGFTLADSPSLRDLSGLAALTNVSYLELRNLPELESLDGLHLPPQMRGISLQNLPRLSSARALSDVKEIDRLALQGTGVQNLDFLVGQRIRRLTLLENGLLQSATLDSAEALEQLDLQRNLRLTSVVLATRAPELQTLEIRSNPALQSVSGLDQPGTFDTLSVSDNPTLSSLSLPGVYTLGRLEILRNPDLSWVKLPLERVERVVVVSNKSLASRLLSSVALRAGKLKLAGNQDEATGLDPCPYERDFYCDSWPIDTLCAAGTDNGDCSEFR